MPVKAGRPMRRLPGLLDGAGEAVGEHDERTRWLAVVERLEHDIVAFLRKRRPVPRAMEGDEGAALVGVRELHAVVYLEIVGRPVRRKPRDWTALLRTGADGLAAIAAVLRGKDQLPLVGVEIAFRPAVIRALIQLQQLFGGLVGALLWPVQVRPVLRELVPAMLHDVEPAGLIKGEPFAMRMPVANRSAGEKCSPVRFAS